jgi:hypothetical protein
MIFVILEKPIRELYMCKKSVSHQGIPQQQCTGQIACLNAFFPGYFVKTKVKYALLCILVLQDLPFNIRIITSYLKMSGMPGVIAKILSSDPEFIWTISLIRFC